ncbi:MAG: DUF411 domain-containing protein [Gemmobacter sp.]|uniref:DUF411 domain-containing protein n=1 Tax=Gemmobacter sp. TaxID=1898957 RepID=UPI00391C00FE
MTRPEALSRRSLMLSGLAAAGLLVTPAVVGAAGPVLHVAKDPDCGCCNAWIDILRAAGLSVTVEHLDPGRLLALKRESGIPKAAFSCHTGRISGYVIEGHVAVADIRRLPDERPDAIGLAVPGMPYGSPGMGPETAREAYDVLLVRRDGRLEVFNRYEAA